MLALGLLSLMAAPAVMPLPDLEALAAAAQGQVGLVAVDLKSGRRLELNANVEFPTQSVFKLPVAMAVLQDVDAGKLALHQPVALGATDARPGVASTFTIPSTHPLSELLRAMIVDSDNTACDKLLSLLGGAKVTGDRVRALGIRGISIQFSEREMHAGGDNGATPAALVDLLAKLAHHQLGLSPSSAKLLDELLTRVSTGPHRLKGRLPAGTVVAHKTGTSGTRDGVTDATNDVGLVTLPDGSRMAIAVLVHAARADERTREDTIARLCRACYDAFASPVLR